MMYNPLTGEHWNFALAVDAWCESMRLVSNERVAPHRWQLRGHPGKVGQFWWEFDNFGAHVGRVVVQNDGFHWETRTRDDGRVMLRGETTSLYEAYRSGGAEREGDLLAMTFAREASSSDGTVMTSCSVPIQEGWHGKPPVAGDVVALVVLKPFHVTGPAGWNHDGDRTWWKQIGPHEHHVTFTAAATPGEELEWEIHKIYFVPPITPFGEE